MTKQKRIYIQKDGKKIMVGKAIFLENGEVDILLQSIPVSGIMKIEQNDFKPKKNYNRKAQS